MSGDDYEPTFPGMPSHTEPIERVETPNDDRYRVIARVLFLFVILASFAAFVWSTLAVFGVCAMYCWSCYLAFVGLLYVGGRLGWRR